MSEQDATFMKRAIALARAGMDSGQGGPFGCVVVMDGSIIGEGSNQVTSTNDPTAHAEIVAIREACKALKSFQLDGCSIYTSCEPCPMCLGAIYWARPDKVFFACTREDAAEVGFDDELIYNEIALPNAERLRVMVSLLRDEGVALFKDWADKPDKIEY
jgi:tRNA(Arg) A34 adenosine deaminase TadA